MNYKYKNNDLSDYLSPKNNFSGFTGTSYCDIWTVTNKYEPKDETLYIKKNCFGTSTAVQKIYASSNWRAKDAYINSNLANLAGRGSCPRPLRDKFQNSSHTKTSIYSGSYLTAYNYSVDSLQGYLQQYRTTMYIRYVAGTGIQISYNSSTWSTIANTKSSNIVIIELVGGGGGGGGSASDDIFIGHWDSIGGGGGGGGAMFSAVVDLSRSGVLCTVIGAGGTRGSPSPSGGDDPAGGGSAGGATYLYKTSASSTNCLCYAPGGSGGGGAGLDDGGSGGAGGSIPTSYLANNIANDSSGVKFAGQVAYALGKSGGKGADDTQSSKLAGSKGTGFSSSTDIVVSILGKGSYTHSGGPGGD
jgi:hypothetical protein